MRSYHRDWGRRRTARRIILDPHRVAQAGILSIVPMEQAGESGMLARTVLWALLWFFPFSAMAQDCADPTDQVTMNACAQASFQRSDAELNSTYKKIMTLLADDPDAKAALVDAQRAWISFRDADCAFSASGVAGGSAYAMIYTNCLDGTTQQRLGDLDYYLNCQEGDLSCPVPSGN
jgi:uncharacterized protein YecT (DUF1311 family)